MSARELPDSVFISRKTTLRQLDVIQRGEWDEMGRRINDDILEQFAVVGSPNEIPRKLKQRYGQHVDRVMATFSFASDEARKAAIEELRAR